MKELPAGSVQKVDYVFEPEVEGGLPCTNCRFDVQMIKPAVPPANWVKYYEYKSYLKAENIGLDQFKNYLATVDNLSELRYIFNVKKLTTGQAKTGMKTFLKNNAPNIFKRIEDGGIGFEKCFALFGVDNATDFKDLIDTPSGFENILKFVETKWKRLKKLTQYNFLPKKAKGVTAAVASYHDPMSSDISPPVKSFGLGKSLLPNDSIHPLCF